jgi:hypothetical protein
MDGLEGAMRQRLPFSQWSPLRKTLAIATFIGAIVAVNFAARAVIPLLPDGIIWPLVIVLTVPGYVILIRRWLHARKERANRLSRWR